MEENISKAASELVLHVKALIYQLKERSLRYELHQFDSGAVMIDVWRSGEFYKVQMSDAGFGWTKITKNVGFCSLPDSGYLAWGVLFSTQWTAVLGQDKEE